MGWRLNFLPVKSAQVQAVQCQHVAHCLGHSRPCISLLYYPNVWLLFSRLTSWDISDAEDPVLISTFQDSFKKTLSKEAQNVSTYNLLDESHIMAPFSSQ